jgi:hypothetical protein
MGKKKVVVKKGVGSTKRHVYKGRVREFRLGSGMPSPSVIREELEEYRDVLMGRLDPPIDRGVMTLMEVANGYFSRACELEQMILQAKAEGWLPKDQGYESLRTQEIRSFKELAKGATELGSRRITWEQHRYKQEQTGLEAI